MVVQVAPSDAGLYGAIKVLHIHLDHLVHVVECYAHSALSTGNIKLGAV